MIKSLFSNVTHGVTFEPDSNECGQLFITLEVMVFYQILVFLNALIKNGYEV